MEFYHPKVLCIDLLNEQHSYDNYHSNQRAICYWTMDSAERDAALINEELKKATPDYKVIIEIACTRTSEELLAVKRSYQLLYKHCLEEDVASQTIGDIRKVCGFLSHYQIVF